MDEAKRRELAVQTQGQQAMAVDTPGGRIHVQCDPGARAFIIEAIANGQSPSSILRQTGSPSYSWAKAALRQNLELRRQYDQAIEDRGDRLAEELIELADQTMPAGLDGPAASAWVQQLRLKVDVRKWAASKLRPRVYGDRIDVAVRDEGISILKALEDANRRVLTIDAE